MFVRIVEMETAREVTEPISAKPAASSPETASPPSFMSARPVLSISWTIAVLLEVIKNPCDVDVMITLTSAVFSEVLFETLSINATRAAFAIALVAEEAALAGGTGAFFAADNVSTSPTICSTLALSASWFNCSSSCFSINSFCFEITSSILRSLSVTKFILRGVL